MNEWQLSPAAKALHSKATNGSMHFSDDCDKFIVTAVDGFVAKAASTPSIRREVYWL